MQPGRSLVLLVCGFLIANSASVHSEPIGPTLADSLFRAALESDGSAEERLGAFERVLKADSDYAPAYHRMGLIWMEIDDPVRRQKAKVALYRALDLDPRNSKYRMSLGDLQWAQGFWYNAANTYQNVSETSPDDAEAAFRVGYHAVKEYLKYKDMMDADVLGSDVVLFEWKHFAREDRAKAIHYLTRSLKADRAYRASYHQLGLVYLESGDLSRMINTFIDMLEVFPNDPDALIYLGLGYQRMKDEEKAYPYYLAALKRMSPEQRAVMENIDMIASTEELDKTGSSSDGDVDLIGFPVEERERFWRARDPLLLTPYSERRLEHYGRVAYANLRFGRPRKGVPGWQTDMGRMYIRYGEAMGSLSQRPEMSGSSSRIEHHHTQTWTYGDFSITFRNRNGLDDWQFETSFDKKRNYLTMSESEFMKHVAPRYVDPFRSRKTVLPFLATAFREDAGIRLEVAYVVPRELTRVTERWESTRRGIFLLDEAWDPVSRRVGRLDPTALLWQGQKSDLAVSETQLLFAPGSYHVIGEVQNTETGDIGVFRTDRDYSYPDSGLALSDLLLARSIEPTNPFPESRNDLQIIPHPTRTFRVGESVFLYFEIYNLTRNAFARTSFDVSYRVGPPESRHVDLALFELVAIASPESELSLETILESSGSETEIRVQYAYPTRNVDERSIEVRTAESTSLKSAVTSGYAGEHPNDFTYLEVDPSELPPGIYQLSVEVRDKVANTSVSETTIFRVVR